MDNRQRLNALDVALNNEMSERAFYLEHAGRTKNPLGKAMFREIADDELEHYERLKQLHEKWKNSQKWPESVPLSVRQTNIRNLMKDTIAGFQGSAGNNDDDLKAIEIAAKFEAKGMEFYADLRDGADDPKEKAFFALLAGMEREHYLSLKDAEEYLKDPESWLRRTERHTFDGA